MAFARTWAETWSSDAASRSNSSAELWSGAVTMLASTGRPWVSVPVLSNRITRPAASCSSAPPPLITTPTRAARDRPDMIAIGAASSSGQGVATTSTATARTGSELSAQAAPATAIVSGTNKVANRSATLTNGADVACACATRRTTPSYVDPSAVAVATNSTGWPVLMPPLRTSSPAVLSFGLASPVSADSSSTAEHSSRPSTGTISPAPTSSRSPGLTSPTAISTTTSPTRRRAVRGALSTSRLNSRRARAAARASSSCPLASITVITAPANGSPTASAPARASRAITSTLGSRRRNAPTVHQVDSVRPSTVPALHETLANVAASSSHAAAPTSNSTAEPRKTSTWRPTGSRSCLVMHYTFCSCNIGRALCALIRGRS